MCRWKPLFDIYKIDTAIYTYIYKGAMNGPPMDLYWATRRVAVGGSSKAASSCCSGSFSMGVSKRVLRARSARSERSEPRERSEACSERSDEVRDCKLNIAQTEART